MLFGLFSRSFGINDSLSLPRFLPFDIHGLLSNPSSLLSWVSEEGDVFVKGFPFAFPGQSVRSFRSYSS